MKLGELTSIFSNDTMIIIELLQDRSNLVELLYTGKIYKYSSYLEEKWPDNNFKNFDIVNAEITNGSLNILIEE